MRILGPREQRHTARHTVRNFQRVAPRPGARRTTQSLRRDVWIAYSVGLMRHLVDVDHTHDAPPVPHHNYAEKTGETDTKDPDLHAGDRG